MSIWGSLLFIVIGAILSAIVVEGIIQIIAAILIIVGVCWLVIGLVSIANHYRVNHPVNTERDNLEDHPIQPG